MDFSWGTDVGRQERGSKIDCKRGPNFSSLESGLVLQLAWANRMWQKGCCAGFELEPGEALHSSPFFLGAPVPAVLSLAFPFSIIREASEITHPECQRAS